MTTNSSDKDHDFDNIFQDLTELKNQASPEPEHHFGIPPEVLPSIVHTDLHDLDSLSHELSALENAQPEELPMLHEVAVHENVSMDNMYPLSFDARPHSTASDEGPTEEDLLIDESQYVSLEEEHDLHEADDLDNLSDARHTESHFKDPGFNDSAHNSNTTDASAIEEDTHELGKKAQRNKLLGILAGSVVGVGALWMGYTTFFVGSIISTDNAYTNVEIAQVTAALGGTVQSIAVKDTAIVKKGDVLVLLDASDAKLVLAQSEAELAKATQRVSGYRATDTGLGATVASKIAAEESAAAQTRASKADLDRASVDLSRRRSLLSAGAVSADEVTKAQNLYALAKANMEIATAAANQAKATREAAEGSQQANATLISSETPDRNPEILLARARRDQAMLDLERTKIVAPVDGVIAKRQVQLGQRVNVGAPLLSVVPVQEMHVLANFKEGQLANVKPGQKVTLTADIYGSTFTYTGTVEGLAAGSGSAFAAIPAQNATGNWIKVVQRVPVRIKLNPSELAQHPLKVGLSMNVEIDTGTK